MPDTIAPDAALCHALLDSRQRWRDLVLTAADIAYETDTWGRFVFVMPDPALGWPSRVAGRPAGRAVARRRYRRERLQPVPRHHAGASSPCLVAAG